MEEISEHLAPAATATVVLDAAPVAVWRALTTQDGLAPWMGAGASVEAEPGGMVVLPDPVGGVTRRGRVERVDSQRLLEFAWWPALKPAERTTVSISLAPEGAGTRLSVTEWSPPRAVLLAQAAPTTAGGSDPFYGPASTRPPGGQRPSQMGHRAMGCQVTDLVTSMLGAWTWRLAVLSLSCSLARV